MDAVSGVSAVGASPRLRPGSVIVFPGGTPHFHWAKSGSNVTQVSAVGPLGPEYIGPTDDAWSQ
jgi:hypothetical protein